MLSTTDIRTILAHICCIERDEIEAGGTLSDKRWRDFQADPHGTFMKLSDQQQAIVARSINRRLAYSQRAAA